MSLSLWPHVGPKSEHRKIRKGKDALQALLLPGASEGGWKGAGGRDGKGAQGSLG